MTYIYREAMRRDFGCEVLKNGKQKLLMHPKGEAFPSYGQYSYWVVKAFGLRQVQTTLYGQARMRSKKLPSAGRFTEELANLMERFEVDGYRVKERPKSVLNGAPMPALIVVRGICCTSGAIVGIGFSLGGEKTEAYRMMLFSAAISKSKFCWLFGLPNISNDDWPAMGLPGFYVSDRGPGASDKLVEDLAYAFPIKQIPQSWAGQSKALVESSQPREMHTEGEPNYLLSELDVIQMARREIMRAVSDNHTSNIGDRLLGIKGSCRHHGDSRGW